MKSIIVAIDSINYHSKLEYLIEELKELAKACDIMVDYQMVQTLKRPNPVSYIGKGKLEELIQFIDAEDIELVIFNDELSPSQMKHLSELISCELIDRTGIILRIFEQRAKTKEAKLQVESAKLNYLLPRLVGANIDKIGQLGGSGFRGSGEKQIELDRRIIHNRLNKIKKELESVALKSEIQRSKRKKNDVPIVALIGYTNSGKSTLMNYFLNHRKNKLVLEKDMVFASLQTSTRLIELENQLPFLLTDTVGFVQELPKHLFKAFRSTLEELLEADLLIQVVDSSSIHYQEHIASTNVILSELKALEIPMIYAYNKVDLGGYASVVAKNPHLFISAKEGTNLNKLEKAITNILLKDGIKVNLKIPYTQGEDYASLVKLTKVIKTDYLDDNIYVEVICPITRIKQFEKYILTN